MYDTLLGVPLSYINNFARLESGPKWSKNIFAKFERRISQTNYKYLSEVNTVSCL